MPAAIARADYAAIYGHTTGDRMRLTDTDTDLRIAVGRDHVTDGEVVKFDGGKVIGDRTGQSRRSRAEGAAGTVITDALIVDHTGIYNAGLGRWNAPIARIRKAGDPDMPPGVDIVIGPST
jgi:urease subunit alpha